MADHLLWSLEAIELEILNVRKLIKKEAYVSITTQCQNMKDIISSRTVSDDALGLKSKDLANINKELNEILDRRVQKHEETKKELREATKKKE